MLVGVLTAVLVYAHPEGLEAPAWVVYAACSAFVFAGLASGGTCRVAFGFGAVIVAALVVWAVLRALRPERVAS